MACISSGAFEIVEAGFAFLRLDDEVFEFPGMTGALGFGSRRGLAGFGVSAGATDWRRRFGGRSGLGLVLRCRYGSGPFSGPSARGWACDGALGTGASCSASLLPNIFLSALSTVISSIG
jgi:hypothetical protein